MANSETAPQPDGSEIAIIGMAGRFPGAADLETFWRNLSAGVESISRLTDQELAAAGVGPELRDDPRYVKAASILEGVELFDAEFFGYTPREAEIMDPQQRLFLECAWTALEHAGYNPQAYTGAVGVYAGARADTYILNLYSHPELLRSLDPAQIGVGNDLSYLSARVAYKLNLRGPSYALHTACSTSLVAVHLACQSLLIDECQLALAGGVAIGVPTRTGYLYQPGGIVSPDGHCRAFDAAAQGTIFGSGVGVVVLKRLEDALDDGDTIHAVIRGSATNNDGAFKASFTAPGVDGQAEVIAEALANAGVAADTISYVEAHGTGTPLGDPIELLALTRAFRTTTERTGFCALGSLKTNIGHLDAAAGIASLIKTVLALKHGLIPPSLHYTQPNPEIDFAASPFYVNTNLTEWNTNGAPRRAGVSSFGFGGTNAHVILEEAPPRMEDGGWRMEDGGRASAVGDVQSAVGSQSSVPALSHVEGVGGRWSAQARPWQLLTLSAKTEAALKEATSNLAAFLARTPAAPLPDIAFTLQRGRTPFAHRRLILARDHQDALQALTDPTAARVHLAHAAGPPRTVAFLLPGQGGLSAPINSALYHAEPAFRQALDRCADILAPSLGYDIRTLLLADGERARGREGERAREDPVRRPLRGRPAEALGQLPKPLDRPAEALGQLPKPLDRPAEALGQLPKPLDRPAEPLGQLPKPLDRPAEPLGQLPKPLDRPAKPLGRTTEAPISNLQSPISQTDHAQPALFALGYALAQLYRSWGLQPSVLLGHSLGELIAATIAGVFTLEDALHLVALRGRLMQAAPPGAMLAVPLDEAAARARLGAALDLAAVNGPRQCVVAGPPDAVAALEAELASEGLHTHRLPTERAFHSRLLDGVVAPFVAEVARVRLKPPTLPVLSNVSGGWLTAAEATDAAYWGRQLRQTVRFGDGLAALRARGELVLLELGPGRALTGLAQQAGLAAVPTLAEDAELDTGGQVQRALGALWLAGVSVDWEALHAPARRRRVALPTYPFQRQRFWIAPEPPVASGAPSQRLVKRPNPAEWLYLPSWKPTLPPQPDGQNQGGNRWLVFADTCGLGDQLVRRLERDGRLAITVVAGSRFEKLAERRYAIDPRKRDDYAALFEELRALGHTPNLIVHAWTVKNGEGFGEGGYPLGASPNSPPNQVIQRGKEGEGFGEGPPSPTSPPNQVIQIGAIDGLPGGEQFEQLQSLGIYSLLALAQALGRHAGDERPHIAVVSNMLQAITGAEVVCPEKATILAPCKVIPQEHPGISCQSIDIVLPPPGTWQQDELLDQLIAELTARTTDRVVAYRGRQRWVPAYEPARPDESRREQPRLRAGGVYLITGGLGTIGLALAEELARNARARLALLGRSTFPAPQDWAPWLAAHAEDDRVSRVIRRLRALEELGAEILVLRADVADLEQMRAALAQVDARFGALHGVIHSAGIVGEQTFRALSETGPAECGLHFHAKVRGVYVLEAILRGRPLDFCLLQSSLAATLGGLGLTAYAAANLFLDAFAHRQSQRSPVPWISINWDAWQSESQERQPAGAAQAALALTPGEGATVLRSILTMRPASQVIVSTADLDARIAQWIHRDGAREPAPATLALHPRPGGQRAYRAPGTELEQIVAGIWQTLLGIERIGADDNFFELGGHSLLATDLVARLGQAFHVDVPLRDFYHAPTVAGLAVLIEKMLLHAANGHALLEKRIQGTTPATGASQPQFASELVHDPDRQFEPFPLTEVQYAYWVGRSPSFELGNVAAHGYLELDTAGLDLARFECAWQQLIARHPMLRAIIRPDGQQQILPQAPPYRIATRDLRGQPPAQVEAELTALREQMSHQLFPTDQWPLFAVSATLLDDHLRLHISLDLLIADAWSLQLLFKEWAQLYRDPAAELAPLTLTFRDYVLAEEAQRQGERYQRALAYWRGRLAELPPPPALPLRADPAALRHPRFVRRAARLDPAAWATLKARAAALDLTPSSLLLALFAEVLARWSGKERFTLTLTLFNRRPLHPQVNQLVGDFTSLTLLAVEPPPTTSFAARARQLQEQLWADLDQRAVGGVQVLRELARHQGRSAAPMPVVFTSTLSQTSARQEAFALSESTEVVYAVSQTPQVWLDQQVAEEDGALLYNWDVVEALFPPALLDAMFDAQSSLLHHLAAPQADWHAPLPELRPHDQLARRQQVHATATPVAPGLLHPPLFAQAAIRPEHLAVITPTRTLTYAELARRAHALAHQIRAHGARPNTLVAVVMEKGWEQVVAVLAILEAGAAYVPLDPSLPPARFQALLEQAQVAIALTQPNLDFGLAWPPHITRLVIDDAPPPELPALPPVQQPSDLAYVIYTSGSTGLPKGVMIDHLAAHNTILDLNSRFQVTPDDRMLGLSALSFDLSVYDIFGVLAAGGTLVLPAPDAHRDPAHWAELAQSAQVTLWNSVPALLEMFATFLAPQPQRWPCSLRLALLSGDWIPLRLPQQVRALAPQLELVSLGGATEAAIWSIYYPITTVEPHWASVPYGLPLDNQQFYVLDASLRECPEWVVGELYIGGAGLAQGYWRDPVRTAERFVPCPWSVVSSQLQRTMDNGPRTTDNKLYKTGDLGRYLPDGNIEFLGRADYQVKVQGYRIELGEVEAALLAHPQVQAAVAAVQGERFGPKRLVAYIVPVQEQRTKNQEQRTDRTTDRKGVLHTPPPDHEPRKGLSHTPSPDHGQRTTDNGQLTVDLRQFLHERLPDYMIPATFVLLDALPLTPNGKVDRQALPAPEQPADAAAYVTPRTPVERALAEVWGSILGREQVGIHDDFFELGGDSILSIQIVARANQLGLRLTPNQLFEHHTIAALATVVGTAPAVQAEQGLVAGPLPLAPAQHWLFEQELPQPDYFNQSVLLELRQALDPALLEQALRQLLLHHDALRLRFARTESGWQQTNAGPDDRPLLSCIDLAALPEPQQAAAIEARAAELHASLSLAEGPLVRAALFDLGPRRTARLLLVIHHLAVDGVSWRILLADLELVCRQLLQDAAPQARLEIRDWRLNGAQSPISNLQLPAKTTSFKQWAERMAEYAQSNIVRQEQAYWRTLAPVAPLPLDAHGHNDVASERVVSVALNAEETRALLQTVPEVYQTQIDHALLTALALAYAGWAGAHGLLVDLEGHGRRVDRRRHRPVAHGRLVHRDLPAAAGAGAGGWAGRGAAGGQSAVVPRPERRHRLRRAVLPGRRPARRGAAGAAAAPDQLQLPGPVRPDPGRLGAIRADARVQRPGAQPFRRTKIPAGCAGADRGRAAARGLGLRRAPAPARNDRAPGRGICARAARDHRPRPVTRRRRLHPGRLPRHRRERRAAGAGAGGNRA